MIGYKTHTRAVGTVYLKPWKTKGWSCKSRLSRKGGFHTRAQNVLLRSKKSQPPLSGNPEWTGAATASAHLHLSPLCWSGVPTPKNVSISPLAAWRPQAFMEPNLGSPPLSLPLSPHSPVSLISPQELPLNTESVLSVESIFSGQTLILEQWGDTLFCAPWGTVTKVFPKVIGKSVVLWLLFPTVVLLLFFTC